MKRDNKLILSPESRKKLQLKIRSGINASRGVTQKQRQNKSPLKLKNKISMRSFIGLNLSQTKDKKQKNLVSNI